MSVFVLWEEAQGPSLKPTGMDLFFLFFFNVHFWNKKNQKNNILGEMLIMDFPSAMWLLENENAKCYTLLLNMLVSAAFQSSVNQKLFGALKICFCY